MRRGRLAVLAFAAASLISQSTIAADLKPAVQAATPHAVHDWSGLYIGGNFGRGWSGTGRWDNVENTTPFGDNIPPDFFTQRASGLLGGGQVGINHQTGAFVFGLEALFDASLIHARHFSIAGAADDVFTGRVESFLLLTGRVGYAWSGLLAYAKGGYAGVNFRASVLDSVPPSTGVGDVSRWLSGWTVGAGFEYALTASLSVGVEYNYVGIGTERYQLGGSAGSYVWDVDPGDIHLVMAKLNYRFASFR